MNAGDPYRSRGLDALFARLAERTGLDFAGCHRDRMIHVLARRCHDKTAAGCAEYAARLDWDAGEYAALVDALTVGETYFFREPVHFDLLREVVVPAWRKAGDAGRFRVWSAGGASGEEAYSVAITLDELGMLQRSSILGTDLSHEATQRARTAVYNRWSLRRSDGPQRDAWFQPEGRRFRLRERYRSAVDWRQLNLLDGPPGEFDVVFCRNVLIYLEPTAVRTATAVLHDSLAPGGWLLMGASDPPLEHEGLQRVPDVHAVVYRRGTNREAGTHQPGSRAAPAAGRAIPALPTGTAAPARPLARPRPDRPAAPPGVPGVPAVDARAIRAIADRGELDRALRLADEAIESDPLDVELRVLTATMHLHAGRSPEAARRAAEAVFLDAELVVGHLVLARAEQQAGRIGPARRSYENALHLLQALPSDHPIPLLDGEQAGALAETIIDQLEGRRR